MCPQCKGCRKHFLLSIAVKSFCESAASLSTFALLRAVLMHFWGFHVYVSKFRLPSIVREELHWRWKNLGSLYLLKTIHLDLSLVFGISMYLLFGTQLLNPCCNFLVYSLSYLNYCTCTRTFCKHCHRSFLHRMSDELICTAVVDAPSDFL